MTPPPPPTPWEAPDLACKPSEPFVQNFALHGMIIALVPHVQYSIPDRGHASEQFPHAVACSTLKPEYVP